MNLTVVIPCYNAEHYLREAIESVLAQTVLPKEIIIIDDGSTDNSGTIARSFSSTLVRVISQANRGLSGARNRGLDEADGEWVAFLDADDIWLPTKLEQQQPLLRHGVVASHTNYFNFHGHPRVDEHFARDTSRMHDESLVDSTTRYTASNVILTQPFNMSSIVIKKSIGLRFGEQYRYFEDVFYCVELVNTGSIALLAEPVVGYRRHTHSLTAPTRSPIEWHKTFEPWLHENAKRLGLDTFDMNGRFIERYLLERLKRAIWTRDWSTADAYRDHLRPYAKVYPTVASAIRRGRMPRWCYGIHDLIRYGQHWDSRPSK